MKRRNILAAILSLIMVISLLVGCADTPDNVGPDEEDSKNEIVDTGDDVKDDDSGEDKEEDVVDNTDWNEADATETFVYVSSASASTLDKWSISAAGLLNVALQLTCDPLVIRDEDYNLCPWLATKWEMAEDGSSITFWLRDDVYFTNGELMTAEDVIFTFERIRDDTERLADATTKTWRPYLGELEKVDEFCFTLNFAKAMPEFWTCVDSASLQIICKSAYEELGYEEYFKAPVGTGAYVITNFDGVNSIIEFELRTDEHGYWGYDATGRKTDVKHIIMKNSPEGSTRVSSLRAGEVDFITNVPADSTDVLMDEGFVVTKNKATTLAFLQTHSAEGEIFANKDLREALSLCIDRDLIVNAILSGFGEAAHHPWREGDLGYNGEALYEYDMERAAELVANSGYNNEPIKFIYTTATVGAATEIAQAIQSSASQIGLNIQLQPLENALFEEARSASDFDIVLATIKASGNTWYKDAAEIVGADRFNTKYDDDLLKEYGAEIASCMDIERQEELYAAIAEREAETFAPNIYIFRPCDLNARVTKYDGYLYHGSGDSVDLKYLVLAD